MTYYHKLLIAYRNKEKSIIIELTDNFYFINQLDKSIDIDLKNGDDK